VSIDMFPGAMPNLVGAPAYARPLTPSATTPRPFDPDDLPLEVDQTDEERAFAASLPARAYAPGGIGVRPHEETADGADPGEAEAPDGEPRLHPRPLRLKGIAGGLLGGR
jgi:hypothetical protein